jgi:hypothetical protein
MGCNAALPSSLVVAVMVAYAWKNKDFGFEGVCDLSCSLSYRQDAVQPLLYFIRLTVVEQEIDSARWPLSQWQ